MAKAFELLKPGVRAEAKRSHNLDPENDYTKDSTCLPCHTSGYGKRGFQSSDATPELAGVTCETCHGSGSGYLKPNLMRLTSKQFKLAEVRAAGLIPPDLKTCHNEQSPFADQATLFDFEQRKKQGGAQDSTPEVPALRLFLSTLRRKSRGREIVGSECFRRGGEKMPSEQFTVVIPEIHYWRQPIKCQAACPVHTDAGGYMRAIAAGDFQRAPISSPEGQTRWMACERHKPHSKLQGGNHEAQ